MKSSSKAGVGGLKLALLCLALLHLDNAVAFAESAGLTEDSSSPGRRQSCNAPCVVGAWGECKCDGVATPPPGGSVPPPPPPTTTTTPAPTPAPTPSPSQNSDGTTTVTRPTPAPSTGGSTPSPQKDSEEVSTPGTTPTLAPKQPIIELIDEKFDEVYCGGQYFSSCKACLDKFGYAPLFRADGISGCNGQCVWVRETGECVLDPGFFGKGTCGTVECSGGEAASCTQCGSKCSTRSGECRYRSKLDEIYSVGSTSMPVSPCMPSDFGYTPIPSLNYNGDTTTGSDGVVSEVALIADYRKVTVQLDTFSLLTHTTDSTVNSVAGAIAGLFGASDGPETDEIIELTLRCSGQEVSKYSRGNMVGGGSYRRQLRREVKQKFNVHEQIHAGKGTRRLTFRRQGGMSKGEEVDIETYDLNCNVGDDIEIYFEEADKSTNDKVTWKMPAWKYASLPASFTGKFAITLQRENFVTKAVGLASDAGLTEYCLSDVVLSGAGALARGATVKATKTVLNSMDNVQASADALKTIEKLKDADKKTGGQVSDFIVEQTVGGLAKAAGFLDFGCVNFDGAINTLLEFFGISGSAIYEVELHLDGWEAANSLPRQERLTPECKCRFGDCGSGSTIRPSTWLTLPLAALASLAALRAFY